MEAVAANIRTTIAMYWEGDRSNVRERYDELFPPPVDGPPPTGPESEDSRPLTDREVSAEDVVTTWGATFEEVIRVAGLSESIAKVLRDVWTQTALPDRPIALHHLIAGINGEWSIAYAFEGIANSFGIWAATHVLHAIHPSESFPLAIEPTYYRLRLIFRILGIDVDDRGESTPIAIAGRISDAIAVFNAEGNWEPWQTWAMVYDLGPRLLPDPAPYSIDVQPKFWIVSGGDTADFEAADRHSNSEIVDWCINSKAKRGDIALMYHLAPRSAFVGVYRCYSDAYHDPFQPRWWTGGRGELTDCIQIPSISAKEMRIDPVLKDWGLVKRSFVGMLQVEVPPPVWNRLKQLISQKDVAIGELLDRYMTASGGVHSIATIGEHLSEKEVEDTLVLPLLKLLGWNLQSNLVRQHEMDIKIGSGRPKRVRADFVGFRDALGSEALMVIETKAKVRTDAELSAAREQCESYAGKLRCRRFAVAAPEGLWVYEMNFPGYSTPLAQIHLQRDVAPPALQKATALLAFSALMSR